MCTIHTHKSLSSKFISFLMKIIISYLGIKYHFYDTVVYVFACSGKKIKRPGRVSGRLLDVGYAM